MRKEDIDRCRFFIEVARKNRVVVKDKDLIGLRNGLLLELQNLVGSIVLLRFAVVENIDYDDAGAGV